MYWHTKGKPLIHGTNQHKDTHLQNRITYELTELISKKETSIEEASGLSRVPNTTTTINCRAWNSHVKYL